MSPKVRQSIANCKRKGKNQNQPYYSTSWWRSVGLIDKVQIDSSSLGVGEGSAIEAGERARSCGRSGAGTSDVS